MTEHERRMKKIVQIVVASAIVFFFGLVVTFTVQVAVMMYQNGVEQSLLARQAELQKQILDEESRIDYYNTERFIEEFALRELGYGRKDSQIFK